MQFELKHVFDAPIAEVLEAMFDPALADYLKSNMKMIKDIKPLERSEEGNRLRRRVRYTPIPLIQSVGPKKISPEMLAFVEESTYDRAAREVTFKNIADSAKVRHHLENGGKLRFRDTGTIQDPIAFGMQDATGKNVGLRLHHH